MGLLIAAEGHGEGLAWAHLTEDEAKFQSRLHLFWWWRFGDAVVLWKHNTIHTITSVEVISNYKAPKRDFLT